MPPSGETPSSSEVRLFARARDGDGAAVVELLDKVQPRLHAVANARLGPGLRTKLHVSDVLQSTYAQVLTSIEGFRGVSEAEFAEWTARIMQRTIRKRARYFDAARRDQKREAQLPDQDVCDGSPDPLEEAALGEQMRLIARAMATLPKDYVRIISLHMDPEQTHERTAELMGRSVGASRVLLSRARSALLIALDELRGGGDDATDRS